MNIPELSVVIIGRNEGERLIHCIEAVQKMNYSSENYEIIYVDSQSTDDSVSSVRNMGLEKVFEVDAEHPCAAMGRNIGLLHAKGTYILFLDGDTQLHPDFINKALPHLKSDKSLGIVFGHRVEMYPDRSLYIKLCGYDWSQRVPGYSSASAGDILARRSVMTEIGGYREIIAGEDPEMSCRVINAGYKILFLGNEMVKHDLGILSFKQYWTHEIRSGVAYALVSDHTKELQTPLWGDKTRRIIMQGGLYLILPIAGVIFSIVFSSFLPMLFVLIMFTMITGRSFIKNKKDGLKDISFNLLYSLHSHFIKIPHFLGVAKYRMNKNQRLIEYKRVQ